jgi:hypothetical protein
MMYSAVRMIAATKILIHITQFDSNITVKCPAEASKCAVLVEAGFSALVGAVNPVKGLIPGDKT